jgi:hypothetical protein
MAISKPKFMARLMHEWVDQFTTQPKSLFTQKICQILEIIISLSMVFIHDLVWHFQ